MQPELRPVCLGSIGWSSSFLSPTSVIPQPIEDQVSAEQDHAFLLWPTNSADADAPSALMRPVTSCANQLQLADVEHGA
jgi:hypothetical protein